MHHHRQGSGSPLVLIHGLGSRWQVWRPVLDAVAEHHDVIAIDLPGFGESPPDESPEAAVTPEAPSHAPGSVPYLADRVAAFLAAEGIERPAFGGSSLGGGVALELARRGLARAVVAFSPVGFFHAAGATWCRAVLAGARVGGKALAPLLPPMLSTRAGRIALCGLFYARPGSLDAAECLADARALINAPGFGPACRAIGSWRLTVHQVESSQLKSIQRASIQRAFTQRASTQRASTQRTSTQRASTEGAPTCRPAGVTNSGAAGERADAQVGERTDVQTEGRTDTHGSERTDAQTEGRPGVHGSERTDAQTKGRTDTHRSERTDAQTTERPDTHRSERTDAQTTGRTDVHGNERTDVQTKRRTEAQASATAGPVARSAIAVPVTIAWGTRDLVLPHWQAARARALLPHARHVTLRGCGHLPFADDPAACVRVLLETT
nr:alpha/beta hydrolase [uncultured Actinoplanes sp.]